jgi:hypothetical protein
MIIESEGGLFFFFVSPSNPKQKKYSMIDRMRRLGFLQDEPNFNEGAYEDFQKALQLSKL